MIATRQMTQTLPKPGTTDSRAGSPTGRLGHRSGPVNYLARLRRPSNRRHVVSAPAAGPGQWDTAPRILLVTLPLDDIDENAAMVDALQRHATVIAQKSLAEGFGLTVSEGMWRARPVIGSAFGAAARLLLGVVRGLVHDGAVAARDLGLVKGGVGGAQRFLVRLRASVEEGGADADGGMNPVGADGV